MMIVLPKVQKMVESFVKVRILGWIKYYPFHFFYKHLRCSSLTITSHIRPSAHNNHRFVLSIRINTDDCCLQYNSSTIYELIPYNQLHQNRCPILYPRIYKLFWIGGTEKSKACSRTLNNKPSRIYWERRELTLQVQLAELKSLTQRRASINEIRSNLTDVTFNSSANGPALSIACSPITQ